MDVSLPGVVNDLLEWMLVYLCIRSSTCAGAIIITNTYSQMSNKMTQLCVTPVVMQPVCVSAGCRFV